MLTKENTKDWMKAHPVNNLPGRIRPSADGGNTSLSSALKLLRRWPKSPACAACPARQ